MLDHPPPHADVGDAGRRVGEQPRVDVLDRGQPLAPEEVRVQRPVDVALRVAGKLPEGLPGNAAAAPERAFDGREGVRERDAVARHGRHVGERLTVDQHLGVARRKPVPPLLGAGLDVVDLEDPGDGLLLEPLAHVDAPACRSRPQARRT